ncbi:unnamed protein product [Polarella glacialis]|uniref:PSI subunit V n=1 Tax=Polarella glacialis TaxID=89957 RepID=A0A813KGP9_POLGL|nr:unnamed protein product [Polarella glacialis]CAE8703314.1 unnamed protein product [Polarella glacialis]
MTRLATACAATAALCFVANKAFVVPGAAGNIGAPVRSAPQALAAAAAPAESAAAASASWGLAAAGLCLGGHVGLAVASRSKAARKAEGEAEVTVKVASKEALKYVETPQDQRLFELVYLQYTSEYMKGPMYWDVAKGQGGLPHYAGEPMTKNGQMTSNVIGNLKTFSSNELAFLSMLFFGIGLYGNIQFLFIDPQWAKVDAGGFFNVSYIVESLLLPISFFFHISCYIQRMNGK